MFWDIKNLITNLERGKIVILVYNKSSNELLSREQYTYTNYTKEFLFL